MKRQFFPERERRAFPALYAALYPRLHALAKEYGYALTIHGSLSRDMDVVAIPWADGAAEAEYLVGALKESLGQYAGTEIMAISGPVEKPYGRRSWSIHMWGHGYIDLSVMPKAVRAEPREVEG